MNLIAGDIGGTKSWLALLSGVDDGSMQLCYEGRYQSDAFNDVIDLLRRFVSDASVDAIVIDSAMLALPGPVASGRCRLTNLDWLVDGKEIESELAITQVTLVNDFQASCAGIATLGDSDLIQLNQAVETHQDLRVVTGAGTGLGLAWMQWQDGAYRSSPTEGGHINFAPAGEAQRELLNYIAQRSDAHHVSYEQLLSGGGLETIYRFVQASHGVHPSGQAINAAMVTGMAMQRDELAEEAVGLFIEIYGGWVGNLALLYRPSGGLYIAGGIAAKIASIMQSERFIQACYDKGAMSDLVKQTPIYLVTNERLGLQGAMAIAQEQQVNRGHGHEQQ